MSRTSALKVLDHAMIGPEGSDNCHKFVDILGLRTVFPLFMKTPKKMKKAGASDKEHEGQSLLKNTIYDNFFPQKARFGASWGNIAELYT